MNLFEHDDKTLAKFLSSLRKEVEEKYYYNGEENFPNSNTHDQALELICIVFQYIKLFQKNLWNLDEMLRCLYLLSKGERLFLLEQSSSIITTVIVNHAIESKAIIFLAVHYLVYYRTFLMNSNDPAFGYRFMSLYEKITSSDSSDIDLNAPKCNINLDFFSDVVIDRNYPLIQKHFFDQYMIGQDDLKKKLAMSVYHYLVRNERKPLLLIGDTGTGKNHTFWILQKFLKKHCIKIPVFVYDSSKLTPNGFSGDDIRNIFLELKKEQASYCTTKAIVYLDEICKIILPNYTSHGENVSRLIQGQILSALSGTKIAGIDTSEILFILGGAFADLRSLRMSRADNHTIGFELNSKLTKMKTASIRDDLIQIGMERELLGRISYIVELNSLDRQSIRKILLHEKIGVLTQKIEDYKMDNLKIYIDDEVIEQICDMVMEQNLGARGITNIVEELFANYHFDMLEQGYSWIRIHSKMLEGEAPIFGREKNEKCC